MTKVQKTMDQTLEHLLKEREINFDLDSFNYTTFDGKTTVTGADLGRTFELMGDLKLDGDPSLKERIDEEYTTDPFASADVFEHLLSQSIMIQIFGRAHIDEGIENDTPFDYSLKVLEAVLITLPSLRSQPWTHFDRVYMAFCGAGDGAYSNNNNVFSYWKRYKKDILAFHTKLSKHVGDSLGVDPQRLSARKEGDLVEALVHADSLGKNSKLKKKLTHRMDKDAEKILDQALKANLSQPSPNYIQPGSFDELLVEQGNLKRLIYTNDRETIDYVRSLGVNFEAYMNLTDHSMVYQHIELLRNDPQLKGKNIYNSVATEMRAKLGILLKEQH